MVHLAYKTDRQRLEMESGSVSLNLVSILNWGMKWVSIAYPEYSTLTITDIKRTQVEQDKIYLNSNNENTVLRYKAKPWLSVHQFWRGIDIRVNDMPKGMAEKLTEVFNQIQYDKKRPNKKTAILHDVGTGAHIHLQVIS